MSKVSATVSVIIPVYNCEAYIEECLRSVCDQTYKNIEIIVIDDGSDDGSFEICERFAEHDNRIILISQKNAGVVTARQRGFEHAHGKYVTFVDGDDWIDPDMIDIMTEKIGDADMVSTGMAWEERKGSRVNRRDLFPAGEYSGNDLQKLYESMIYNVSSGMSHSLSCWMCGKMFDMHSATQIHAKLDPSLTVFEDAAFVFQYVLKCERIVLADAYPYHYRYNDDSAWHKADNAALEKIGRTYAYMCETLSDSPQAYGISKQLQYWLLEKCYFTVNERMGIPSGCRMIRFLLDDRGLENKRIVLYGAGRCGRDTRFQLEGMSSEIVLWADKRYEECRKEGLDVSSPSDILKTDYDMVLVAVENEGLAGTITGDLIGMGVEPKRIVRANIKRAF